MGVRRCCGGEREDGVPNKHATPARPGVAAQSRRAAGSTSPLSGDEDARHFITGLVVFHELSDFITLDGHFELRSMKEKKMGYHYPDNSLS